MSNINKNKANYSLASFNVLSNNGHPFSSVFNNRFKSSKQRISYYY